jgi:hypothetical protein
MDSPESLAIVKDFEGEYPKSPHNLVVSELNRGVVKNRKSKKIIGSSGRTRTYNPSVNRTFAHVVSTTYAERLAA